MVIGLLTAFGLSLNTGDAELRARAEKVRAVYAPKIEAMGYSLLYRMEWDRTEMAYATRDEVTRQMEVTVTGDYARRPGLTPDGFSLVLCHEFGHLLGGAPWSPANNQSYEVQAEYYATLRCFKEVYRNDDNEAYVSAHRTELSPAMKRLCSKTYRKKNRALCERGMMAAENAVRSAYPEADVRVGIPAEDEPLWFNDFYHRGSPQCRLETLVAGLLCNANDDFDIWDETKGACTRGNPKALRPTCAYNPETMPQIHELNREYIRLNPDGAFQRSTKEGLR